MRPLNETTIITLAVATVCVALLAFFAFLAWRVTGEHAHVQPIRSQNERVVRVAQARACAIANADPRDVGICLRLIGR